MSELCLSSSCLVEVRSGYPHASKSGISTVFAIIEIDWMQQNCKKMTKDGKKIEPMSTQKNCHRLSDHGFMRVQFAKF